MRACVRARFACDSRLPKCCCNINGSLLSRLAAENSELINEQTNLVVSLPPAHAVDMKIPEFQDLLEMHSAYLLPGSLIIH